MIAPVSVQGFRKIGIYDGCRHIALRAELIIERVVIPPRDDVDRCWRTLLFKRFPERLRLSLQVRRLRIEHEKTFGVGQSGVADRRQTLPVGR